MAQLNPATMSKDLKSWGVALIIIGALHFVMPFLAPFWGMVVIPLGILALVICHRVMFIFLGLSLVVVGLLNIGGTINANAVGFWTGMGAFQVYWGLKEMTKFVKYGQVSQAPFLLLEGKTAK